MVNHPPPILKPQLITVGAFSCPIAPVPARCLGFLPEANGLRQSPEFAPPLFFIDELLLQRPVKHQLFFSPLHGEAIYPAMLRLVVGIS
ncbi:MAG: hypothetical protein HS120_07645 [Burkholderiales bacterium]|nr:hypothetical protein [Burkholderiales bacterium]